jgi:hypothetical protein
MEKLISTLVEAQSVHSITTDEQRMQVIPKQSSMLICALEA